MNFRSAQWPGIVPSLGALAGPLFVAALCALTGRLAAVTPAMAEPPDRQGRCEWQAQHSFLQIKDAADSDDEFRERNEKVSLDYHPYYNAAIGRCLMLVEMSETSPSEVSHTAYVVDADKPWREYAFYREIGGKPIVCELKPSWGTVKFCNNRDDFDAFIARYLDQ